MKRKRKRTSGATMIAGLLIVAQPAPAESSGISNTSDGEQVYRHICQGCHMPDGEGAVGAGYYPAFAGNPNMVSAQYMALTILNGRRNMPSFVERNLSGAEFWDTVMLNDAQVAGVVNYIRSHFSNTYKDALTAAEVKALHPK